MTQFGIIRLDRKRIGLAFRDRIPTEVIPQSGIRIKAITVIPSCLGRLIYHLLNRFLSAFPDDCPTQQTTGFAVYNCKNVDFVFLSPINVNSSSISASFTSSGSGACGKVSARSTTQSATVR